MNRLRRALCAVLCALLCIVPLSGCDRSKEYRIIDTYSAEGSYSMAFRQGDKICDYVSAALRELAANGSLRSASYRWFGEDLVCVKGVGGEMDELRDEVPQRLITVGVDINNIPMSYESPEGYMGFDIDVANYICGYLGWQMAIYPIDPAKVDVELQSGNIDMAMGIPESDLRESFSYSPAYLTSRYVLVANVSGKVRDRSALRGRNLGVSVADLEILMQDQKFVDSLGSITYQTNTESLFHALLGGEVDCILASSVVTAYYMNIK